MTLKRSLPEILIILTILLVTNEKLHAQQSGTKRFPDKMQFDLGVFDCLDKQQSMTGFVDVQYQIGTKIKILYPVAGFLCHFNDGYYLYGGIILPIELNHHLILQPSFAPGYYVEGENSIDLGYPLEFRTGVALIYQVKESFSLGLEFTHISNANLGHSNPGIETIGLLFRFPVTRTGL